VDDLTTFEATRSRQLQGLWSAHEKAHIVPRVSSQARTCRKSRVAAFAMTLVGFPVFALNSEASPNPMEEPIYTEAAITSESCSPIAWENASSTILVCDATLWEGSL
jgi:hypothetical protein